MVDSVTDAELSRRNVLLGVGGAVVLTAAGAGAGYAIAEGKEEEHAAAPPAAAPPDPAKYRSRPDLRALPDVTITTPAHATAPGAIFLTPASGTGLWGPLMVDEKGSPVWFRKVPDPATVAIDFKVQQYRNKPVLTWWEGTIGGTGGRRIDHRLGIVPAATAALPPFTAALALELAPLRVNLVAAGFVDTPLSASLLGDHLESRREQLRATLPIGRVVTADDVAALAVHLMVNTALTGATYDIDGGQQFT